MKYVIGIDLGTSAVKALLLNKDGKVCIEVSKAYPLIQEHSGYSEQDPEQWVTKTIEALKEITSQFEGDVEHIEGISFSGQMHGLVLLDKNNKLLRNAILWNDTRTTEQCQQIYERVGENHLLQLTKNPALEGFTLPKLLWVKTYERELFDKIGTFLLPKDYLRYKMTGKLHSEYSDAAGTLLLNVGEKQWSTEICSLVGIDPNICPSLVSSHEYIGPLTAEFSRATGLSPSTKVFAGGADNACGAIGAGILAEGDTLCSIGTSGVILSYEETKDPDFNGKVHFFNHGQSDAYYSMGVTLSAGHSLSWFKETFANQYDFDELLNRIDKVPIGSNGLLFTPYLVGERTPHADATIRASFIGIDASHKLDNFTRAVVEGITFSLNESIEIFRDSGKEIHTIVSIGGGAKSEVWLQIQADVFNANIVKIKTEQGPALGAAMIAAFGCRWFSSLKSCSDAFLEVEKVYTPIEANVEKYKKIFDIYKSIYSHTNEINQNIRKL